MKTEIITDKCDHCEKTFFGFTEGQVAQYKEQHMRYKHKELKKDES